MKLRKIGTRMVSCLCMVSVLAGSVPLTDTVHAADPFYDEGNSVMIDKGGYKTEIFGVGTDDWGLTWKNRTETLPPSKTYLTDNYRQTVGTVPTSDWASSVVFDQYSEALYAHPLAYRAASNGMQMAAPAVTDTTSYVDDEPSVESLLDAESVELVVGAEGFTAKDASVDKTTDWTYELVMENTAGTSSMRATIGKGTPYAYYTFDNLTPTISLGAGATELSIFKGNTSSNMIGVSLKNKTDGKMHYYGIYAPAGTTWTNAGGKLTANLPSGKNYLSIAILPDNSNAAYELYQTYAFDFITDTKVEWEYHENESKVYTRYNVVTTNMETGAAGGDTIIALYPHQWRYADETFTGYTYDTIRGTMKTIVGSSYLTCMTYNGILSTLPVSSDAATIGTIKEQLGYLYSYRKEKDDPKWICYLEGQYGGYDTYWVGKNLNTLSDAIFLSDQLDEGDAAQTSITNDMVTGVEEYLQFWFDPYAGYLSGNYVDDYFYYDEDYGTLIGYPASYSSDKEVNDHHFHYGYWIKAAAACAMNDPQWATEWGGMVYEMISDIANTNRDGSSYNASSPAKYPFLRNYDIYEGHSWASGVANYEYDENGNLIDAKGGLAGGNNQESSSEAVNAWSSLILWGEAVGDKTIRDLGVYLYTTEIAAIEDYYYDVHDEIFTDAYEDKTGYDMQTVTRLFGGRYDHTAWWTENSIEVTTITMLPISGSTLYLGKYPNKVKAVADSINETSSQWTHFVANKSQICANYGKTDMLTDPQTNQDVMAEYYAYYDPDAALDMYDMSDTGKVENGESRAHTYAYITSLQKYGMQNFEITASSPTALVMEKNGVKTYIAENYSSEQKRVYYSDGSYVDVAANSSYVGDAAGAEENPNVDDSEITGPSKKYNLEVYLQNEAKNGYDKTSRIVNVKSESDVYTYTPAVLTGFTYDSTNAGNLLTVNVAEGNVETVRVYYNRNSYTVSYVLDGGTNAANPTGYQYGESVALKDAVKSGYLFEGWYTDSDFKNQITAITATTAGNLTLYAKFIDASLMTEYTVEHYKQKADGSDYELVTADTQNISGIIGESVTAVAKIYEGYTLNDNSVLSGVILPDKGLILRLYYDSNAVSKPEGDDNWEGSGIKIGDDGTITLYVGNAADKTMVLGYCAVYTDKSQADAALTQVNSGNFAGIPGYTLEKDSSTGVFKKVLDQKATDDTYFVYRFNIQDQTFTDWQLQSAAEIIEEAAAAVQYNYTVHYYQQKTDASGYDEVTADKKTLAGAADKVVIAPVLSYEGFSLNAKTSTQSGTVTSDGNLALYVYYDRNVYTISYQNAGGSTHSNPLTYRYGQRISLASAVRSGETFEGWYDSESYTNQINEIVVGTAKNITVYAKWATKLPTTESGTETEKETETGSETGKEPGKDTETGTGSTTEQKTVITLKAKSVKIKPGQKLKNIKGISGKTGTMTCKSSNKKIATVTNAGVVKGVAAGKATIKITVNGVSASFKVIVTPKKVTKVKVIKKNATAAVIKWKKTSGATGYQISVKTGKKGKYKVVKNIKKAKTVKYTLKKLKKGKTYYVKIRAYKKINGKKVYGKYSVVRKYKA